MILQPSTRRGIEHVPAGRVECEPDPFADRGVIPARKGHDKTLSGADAVQQRLRPGRLDEIDIQHK